VGAGFELEAGEGATTGDAADDLAIAPVLARALAQGLDLPALCFGVAAVPTQQVAGEDGGLIPARARPDLKEKVALVARVAREQQALQLALLLLQALLYGAQLIITERPDFDIGVGGHLLCADKLPLQAPIVSEGRGGRLQTCVLHRKFPELLRNSNNLRIGEQVSEFLEALLGLFEFLAD
jgi:hypothetical protein